MSIRIAPAARDHQIRAVADLLAGGWVYLVTGDRPAGLHDALADDAVLVRVPIGSFGVVVPVDGLMVASTLKATVERPGAIRWFRILSVNLDPIFDGIVGRDAREDPLPDLVLARVDVLPGDIVTIDELIISVPE